MAVNLWHGSHLTDSIVKCFTYDSVSQKFKGYNLDIDRKVVMMMAINIAINGFGRIGRLAFRQLLIRKDIELQPSMILQVLRCLRTC